MLNYSKRLSMRREIQNPQTFQPNPESFSRAIIFRRCPFFKKKIRKIRKIQIGFSKNFEKFLNISKKIEKNSTTQFVLSSNCFWFLVFG
jgi:hypothetical protein